MPLSFGKTAPRQTHLLSLNNEDSSTNGPSRPVTELPVSWQSLHATRSMPAGSNCSGTVARLLALGGLLLVLPTGSVFGHGGFHERIAYLTAEAKKKPSDPLLHFELANLHGQHGDLQLALLNLDRVDALAPGKFLTDLLRGEAWLVAGEFTKAKEALDRQLVSHPECARAWLLRARAERKLGQDAASLADYREALKRTASPEPDLVQEVAGALATGGCQERKLPRCWPRVLKSWVKSLRSFFEPWIWRLR